MKKEIDKKLVALIVVLGAVFLIAIIMLIHDISTRRAVLKLITEYADRPTHRAYTSGIEYYAVLRTRMIICRIVAIISVVAECFAVYKLLKKNKKVESSPNNLLD